MSAFACIFKGKTRTPAMWRYAAPQRTGYKDLLRGSRFTSSRPIPAQGTQGVCKGFRTDPWTKATLGPARRRVVWSVQSPTVLKPTSCGLRLPIDQQDATGPKHI